MAKIMVSAKSTKFPPASEGTHVAFLNTIVDLGLQPSRFGTQPKRELYLAFEVTDEFNEWTDKDGLRCEPRRVSTTVTASLSEKAKLRQYVEGILGTRLSEADKRNFDLVELVMGKPCLLHVVHNESNGNLYANISSIAPLPKSITAPPMKGEPLDYSIDEPDDAAWDRLPKFLQEKIANRVIEEKAEPTTATEEFNDEIPF